MSAATLEASHNLASQISASSVDVDAGVIRGCTVAKAGVQATGKFLMLDAQGKITWDENLSRKELPIFTDDKTLSTLMVAAKAAGERLKVREDHDDAIGARAGYADAFVLTNDDRVVADIHLFRAYRNREVVLETSKDTPGEIGLSIDFTPLYEIVGERALMRVAELHAVDIVDEGAITPGGLLLSAGVDTRAKSVEQRKNQSAQPSEHMAATLEDIMTALGEMTKANAVLAKQLNDQQAVLTKLTTPPAAATPDPKAEEALKATTELKTQLAAVTTSLAQMKKEKALLGFRGTETEKAQLSSSSAEDIEKLSAEKKDYLQLVAARVETAKCSKTDAHVFVMKNHKAEYAAHLVAKGTVKATMAA